MRKKLVVGIDEVGYGALAGPLYLVAFWAPQDWKGPPGLRDSKQMSAAQRKEALSVLVKDMVHEKIHRPIHEMGKNIGYRLEERSPAAIDEVGVWRRIGDMRASLLRFVLSARAPGVELDVIYDGDHCPQVLTPTSVRVSALRKADDLIPQVSAASVIAKELRDHLMREEAKKYPGYGFETNVGYPSKEHTAAIQRLGITPIHRKSYAPVRKYLEEASKRLVGSIK